jgi:hypothetical protein
MRKMMNFSGLQRSFILVSLLIAAGSAKAQIYPKFDSPKLFVSPETVSLWTEVPAKDYWISNSQVFVSGNESDWVKYFGMLGVMLNQSQNASTVSSIEDGLRVKFDRELARALNAKIASRASAATKFHVVDNAEVAQVKLLPSARLTVFKDNNAYLTFRLSVRYKDEANRSEGKKEYYSTVSAKTLGGPRSWSEANGRELNKAAAEMLPIMAEVLLDDLSGAFASAYAPDSRQFIRFSGIGGGNAVQAVLAKEYPGHYVIVPMYKDKIIQSHINILDRRTVVVHPN